jgi:hypothetical protein
MPKQPSVRNKYRAKKDRLEITIKHYSMKKKSERKDLMNHLLRWLEGSPGLARATKRRPRGASCQKLLGRKTNCLWAEIELSGKTAALSAGN